MPGFPSGIEERTFTRATSFLETIGWTGPVSISCDDTQLLSKFAPYYDGARGCWFVLGGIGEPVEIDGDCDDVEEMVGKAISNGQKATKVRY